MSATRKLALLFGMAIVIGTFSSSAKADEFDKRTIFTFSAPVELPGVVLPAGTYVFKLFDSPSTRNIVQVSDENQTKVYATILTLSAERLRPTDNTIVEFHETADGPANALKMWFYPGDISGQEFVYPRARRAELAGTAKQPPTVISSTLSSLQAQP